MAEEVPPGVVIYNRYETQFERGLRPLLDSVYDYVIAGLDPNQRVHEQLSHAEVHKILQYCLMQLVASIDPNNSYWSLLPMYQENQTSLALSQDEQPEAPIVLPEESDNTIQLETRPISDKAAQVLDSCIRMHPTQYMQNVYTHPLPAPEVGAPIGPERHGFKCTTDNQSVLEELDYTASIFADQTNPAHAEFLILAMAVLSPAMLPDPKKSNQRDWGEIYTLLPAYDRFGNLIFHNLRESVRPKEDLRKATKDELQQLYIRYLLTRTLGQGNIFNQNPPEGIAKKLYEKYFRNRKTNITVEMVATALSKMPEIGKHRAIAILGPSNGGKSNISSSIRHLQQSAVNGRVMFDGQSLDVNRARYVEADRPSNLIDSASKQPDAASELMDVVELPAIAPLGPSSGPEGLRNLVVKDDLAKLDPNAPLFSSAIWSFLAKGSDKKALWATTKDDIVAARKALDKLDVIKDEAKTTDILKLLFKFYKELSPVLRSAIFLSSVTNVPIEFIESSDLAAISIDNGHIAPAARTQRTIKVLENVGVLNNTTSPVEEGRAKVVPYDGKSPKLTILQKINDVLTPSGKKEAYTSNIHVTLQSLIECLAFYEK